MSTKRPVWRLLLWVQDWTSDMEEIRTLCGDIQEHYNNRYDVQTLREVCNELLSKVNLPKARKAELHYYLAGLASDDEDDDDQWEQYKINYLEAEMAIVDIEMWLEAHGKIDVEVQGTRNALDIMREDSLRRDAQKEKPSQLAKENKQAIVQSTPKKPYRDPTLPAGQQIKPTVVVEYKERPDLQFEFDKVERYRQALEGSYELEAAETKARAAAIAEAKARAVAEDEERMNAEINAFNAQQDRKEKEDAQKKKEAAATKNMKGSLRMKARNKLHAGQRMMSLGDIRRQLGVESESDEKSKKNGNDPEREEEGGGQ